MSPKQNTLKHRLLIQVLLTSKSMSIPAVEGNRGQLSTQNQQAGDVSSNKVKVNTGTDSWEPALNGKPSMAKIAVKRNNPGVSEIKVTHPRMWTSEVETEILQIRDKHNTKIVWFYLNGSYENNPLRFFTLFILGVYRYIHCILNNEL